MTKPRSILTLLLGVLFAGAVIVYSFFQPFEENAVCKPIPDDAMFIFKAAGLSELLSSPVCSQIDAALGAGNSLKELAADNPWTALAAASEIAVADLPFRDAGQQKTWAAVSWVGWRSPWLRWKLEGAAGEQLQLVGKHSVWPVWKYTAPGLADGKHLMLALTDNLLIACLSENPTDILILLDTYDKRLPLHALRK